MMTLFQSPALSTPSAVSGYYKRKITNFKINDMIHRLKVKKLNDKLNFDFNFYPDLNIFTGKNGCGKTTVLKLIWYLAGGNIIQMFREINFEYLLFTSDNVKAEFTLFTKDQEKHINGYYKTKGVERKYKDTRIRDIQEEEVFYPHRAFGKSIFFPTFRRIEGGFSIDSDGKEEYIYHRELGRQIRIGREDNLNSALYELSRKITPNLDNKFIASISTNDIIRLLNEKYTEILERTRRLENEQSTIILRKVRNRRQEENILDQIEKLVEKTDEQKSELMKPFNVLSHLIQEIYVDKSIEISRTLTLGETKDAITSDKLSAGEKQMLSFLCYNFFSDNTAIFIDEPELSLHTDWQRILFPTLIEQNTNNQFFVSTHSPFIYSKYPSNEHILDKDKGGSL
jgi:predicted ATPase